MPGIIDDLNVYVVTFNCGRALIDSDAFASELFKGLSSDVLPSIIVLNLQEIAPVSPSFIGGSFLIPYYSRFHESVQKAARDEFKSSGNASLEGIRNPYKAITVRNVGMIAMMVFQLATNNDKIQNLETAGVGLGMANMGNKAAVGVRFKYASEVSLGPVTPAVELTFVSAHLAPHEFALQRRNEDWKNIVRRLVFSSSARSSTTTTQQNLPSTAGEERPLLSISPREATIYKPTSHLFLAGDLNYRTSTISPSPTDHIDSFPQPHHDPSSPQHYTNLFENDQLNQEIRAGRTCHGLVEAPVEFPPTYKYEPEEAFTSDDQKWHWAKHRWPSWCDRILYLDMPPWMRPLNSQGKIQPLKYSSLGLLRTSDHQAVALEISVPFQLDTTEHPQEDEESDDPRVNPPFDIDIDWKKKRDRGRTLELINGYTLFLTTTTEGLAILIGILAGIVGAYFGFKALL